MYHESTHVPSLDELRVCNVETLAFVQWAAETANLDLDELITVAVRFAATRFKEIRAGVGYYPHDWPNHGFELVVAEFADLLRDRLDSRRVEDCFADEPTAAFVGTMYAETVANIDTHLAAEVLLKHRGVPRNVLESKAA